MSQGNGQKVMGRCGGAGERAWGKAGGRGGGGGRLEKWIGKSLQPLRPPLLTFADVLVATAPPNLPPICVCPASAPPPVRHPIDELPCITNTHTH